MILHSITVVLVVILGCYRRYCCHVVTIATVAVVCSRGTVCHSIRHVRPRRTYIAIAVAVDVAGNVDVALAAPATGAVAVVFGRCCC